MKDSTDNKNNELDQYGVWVKTPPRNPQETGNDSSAASSIDETLPDFSFLDSTTDSPTASVKNPFEAEDTSLTPDELSHITGSVEEPAKPTSTGEEEISLDDFITGGFSDAPAEETKAPKAEEPAPAGDTEVSLDDFLGAGDSSSPSAAPDGDISLDSFLGPDASSGNGEVSLDDFMSPSQKEEAKPTEIVDEKPMDIDLSFDDSMAISEEAPVEEQHEAVPDMPVTAASPASSTEEVDLSSFDSVSDSTAAKTSTVDLDNFDSVFNTIVDEGSNTSSGFTSAPAADGTESVNLSDFGINTDAGDHNVILPSGHTEKVVESTDYAMDVTTDEETVAPEPIEEGSSDETKEESVIIDAQPEATTATESAPNTSTDAISMGAPTEDDFDVDSILNSVKDEQGKMVCVGNAAEALSKEVDSVSLDETAATPAPIEPETIEDLGQETTATVSSDMPAEVIADTIPDTFEEETSFLSDTPVKETAETPADASIDIPAFLPDDIAATIDSTEVAPEEPETTTSSFTEFNEADFAETASAIDNTIPSVEETPMVDETTSFVDETPIVEETAPISEEAPVVEETTPFVEETPAVEETTSIVEETPAVEETMPVAEETTSVVEETPTVAETTPVIEESSFTSQPYAAVAQPSSELDDENHEILKQIAGELSALKDEISGLKLEFADLKKTSVVSTDITSTKTPEDKSEGFFSGTDEDDTIALSGDELDNILNNADFTATQPSVEPSPVLEETSFVNGIPSISVAPTETPVEEVPVADEEPAPSPTMVTDDTSILGPVDVDVEIPEQDDYDNVPTNLKMDFANEKLEEPVFDNVDFTTTPTEDADVNKTLPEEISIPKVDDVLVESSNTDLMNTAVTNTTVAPEQPSEELPEEIEEVAPEEDISTVDELPAAQSEIITTDSITKPIDLFKEEEPSPLTEEKINYLAEESENLEEPVDSVFSQWDTPAAEEPVVEETAAPEPSILDEVPVVEEEPVSEPVASQPAVTEQTPTTTDTSSIPSDMKQEIKSVLSYMDQLLENLPEDKITEFAQSEQFETYKKLFVELGLA